MIKYLQLTALSFLFFSASISAQVTLTASGINPLAGETFTLVNTNHVAAGNTGANQTWNLSSMTSTSNSIYTVRAPGSSIIDGSFPNANVVWSNPTVSTYFKTSSSALQLYGTYTVSNSVAKIYSNPEDMLHFPFTFNDSYTDSWNNQYVNGTTTYYQRGTTTVTCDGYGTLITPSGTYNNVARIHLQQAFVDSTYAINLPMVINFTSDQYYWYMNGSHSWLASLFSMNNNITGTIQAGTYLLSPVSVNNLEATISNITFYPNPVVNSVSANFYLAQANSVEVKVYNALGAIVATNKNEELKQGMNKVSLNLETFSNGIYFAQVIVGGKLAETKKIVVAK